MKIGICDTILALNPTAQVSCSGDDVNRITWENGTQPIAKNIILAKQLELQTEEDAKLAQQESKKKSAIAKLKALGLDEEEVKSIIGI